MRSTLAPLPMLALVASVAGCDKPATSPQTAGAPAPLATSEKLAAAPEGESEQSSARSTPVDASAPPLRRLSQDWARDSELMLSNHHPVDDLARCPRAPREPGAQSAALVPPAFVRFEGIAAHACDAVLWVFLGCTAATGDGAACESWSERLVLEPAGGGAARVLGGVEAVRGGNAGGLYVPFAFSRDDQWVLLRAWMFSPGAGGGAVDYGVGVIARSTRSERSAIEVRPFPVRDPSFYADFGCAIGLGASDQTPSYTQPGFPSNNGGALVAVDLETLGARTLLGERDTTYTVARLDETTRTLDVDVAKHTFGKDCPREEGALSCAASTHARRTMALPPCTSGQGARAPNPK